MPLAGGQTVTGRDFGNRQQVCTTPPPGMAGWWSGDGTPADLTPNAHHGTLVGGATYASGKVGQAFSFPTTSDYASVPDAPALNVGTGDFSIDAWVRATTPTAMIVSKNGGTGTNPVGYSFYITSGQLSLVINDGSQSLGVAGGNNGTPLHDGQWHFVAVTVQRGSPSTFTFYVDGQQTVTSTTGSANPTGSLSNTSPQLIGRYAFIPNMGTAQQVDELELFPRVLTPGEVAAIHAAGSAGKCKSPVGTEAVPSTPTGVVLGDNHPDPFRTTTQIGYTLPHATHVRLDVYDLLGRRVVTLVDAEQPAGMHTATFDGHGLPSGLYFYRLSAGAAVATRSLILLD